jgi:tRNA A-37 threonylcarbamoyl transferase component Bud32
MSESEKLFNHSHENQEARASRELEAILDNPEYVFLSSIPANVRAIEAAETAIEALQIAQQKIEERERRTFVFKRVENVEGVQEQELTYKGLRKTFKEITEHRQSIGEGGDAIVYVANEELKRGTTDLCYKFARQVGLHRGRNTMERELDIQAAFYDAVAAIPASRIGVPEPLYYCEMGNQKMLAMQYLKAKSIDHLQRGYGSVPSWLTEAHIDIFCDELMRVLDELHKSGLYHRDLHLGNIMLTQSQEEEQVLGYIIDFGVSAYGQEGMSPYRDEVRGEVFTYDDDYGRIKTVRAELKRLRSI